MSDNALRLFVLLFALWTFAVGEGVQLIGLWQLFVLGLYEVGCAFNNYSGPSRSAVGTYYAGP